MSEQDHRVALITGASQGIGAGLVAGYRRRGWAVVATSRTIKAAGDPAVLTVDGDISDPATTDRLIERGAGALRAHRHPDQQRRRVHRQTLHGLHRRRLRGCRRRQPHRVLLADPAHHHRDARATRWPHRQHLHHPRRLRRLQHALRADRPDQGRPRRGHQVTGHRVRRPAASGSTPSRWASSRRRSTRRRRTTRSPVATPSGGWGRSATSSTASSSWSRRRSSPARSCTSTAARSPDTDPEPA